MSARVANLGIIIEEQQAEIDHLTAMCDQWKNAYQLACKTGDELTDKWNTATRENARLRILLGKLRTALEMIAKAEEGWGPFARAALNEQKP